MLQGVQLAVDLYLETYFGHHISSSSSSLQTDCSSSADVSRTSLFFFKIILMASSRAFKPAQAGGVRRPALGAGAASLKAALRAISGISDELLGPLSRSLDEAATTEPRDRSRTLLDVETGAYRIQVLED